MPQARAHGRCSLSRVRALKTCLGSRAARDWHARRVIRPGAWWWGPHWGGQTRTRVCGRRGGRGESVRKSVKEPHHNAPLQKGAPGTEEGLPRATLWQGVCFITINLLQHTSTRHMGCGFQTQSASPVAGAGAHCKRTLGRSYLPTLRTPAWQACTFQLRVWCRRQRSLCRLSAGR